MTEEAQIGDAVSGTVTEVAQNSPESPEDAPQGPESSESASNAPGPTTEPQKAPDIELIARCGYEVVRTLDRVLCGECACPWSTAKDEIKESFRCRVKHYIENPFDERDSEVIESNLMQEKVFFALVRAMK